ncbi:MAG: HYR domain-containing protein, partial [Lysobacter sp.]|nr:HYR domain-containing protein [Lysobacter sp.]
MNTRNVPARLRGILVAAVCLAGGIAASPVFAQQCPPEARIQALAQTVNEGLPVSPNGNSSKPNNATYLWEVVSGPGPITWTPSATDPHPTFTAPQVTGDQQLVIKLTVRGCSPATSHSTTGTITIKDTTAPPSNTAPTAVASANPPIANEGVTVTLNGSSSTDPENNPLTYAWTQTGGPSVTLSDAGAAQPTFVTPHLADPAGATLTFKLRVTDTGGLFNETSVVVNVLFANDSPFASLHCPAVVQEGDSVTLDGSASSDYEDDANNTALKYKWSQLSGPPNIDVGNETGASVTFNAPVLSTGEVGNIEFELTVTDSGNLSTTATCGIFIEDVTAPVFSGDEDRTEEATGPGGANVFYDGLAAIDNVEGDVSDAIVCVPPSGTLFAIGPATSVACAVEDSNHNGRETSFDVLVQDTTKPVIDDHDDVAVEAEGPGGTVVAYDAPGTFDVVDVDLMATCAPPSGTEFAVGPNTVTCNATDTAGNAADATTFQVTVHDTTPPDVTVPADIEAEATSPAGASVTFTASAFDIVDEAITPTCVAASGSTFALGTTEVTCSATDKAGNTGSAKFNVKVVDTTDPNLHVPANITAEATSNAGAAVSFTVTADDLVDTNVDIVCSPASGSTFAIATTTVNCTATDDSGNDVSGSFTVEVQDTTPPVVDWHADIDVIATSNSSAVVTYTKPGAHDIVDGPLTTTCTPDSGATFPMGPTTVKCTATDAAGNTGEGTFKVLVRYNFGGFLRPIDNLPTTNLVQAGQAIPVKFSLGGNQGMNIFSTGYPRVVTMS